MQQSVGSEISIEEDNTATSTARSIAGSLTFSPPAMLRNAVGGRGSECLHLDEQGTYAFHGYGYRDTREAVSVRTEQQLRGIRYLAQAVLLHLEYTDLRS